jgi:hypothetical protein
MTLDDFFRGRDESRRIFDALRAAVEAVGPVELRVTKSQVAFRKVPAQLRGRGIAFAWAWMPDVYLGPGHAPLVLTVALRRRDSSPRWKQVVEPVPGRFTHHLELYSPGEIDDEVRAWLAEAWQAAQ